MIRLYSTACLLAVLFASIANHSPAYAAVSTGNITGLVADASTSSSISGATVSTSGKTATTDSTGHYTLSGVPVGTQTVTATASAYRTNSVQVSVTRRLTVTAPRINLAQNWGTVTGIVTRSSDAAAIAGAVITVAGTTLTATTNSGGSFTLSQVPAGTETVTASAAGFQISSQSVNVPTGGGVTSNFALATAAVSGPGSTILWNGANSYLLGANYAWQNCGTDFGTGGWGKFTDWSAISTDFAAMHSQGVSVVRWWVFADGRYSPDFNSDGTVSGLDSYVLGNIDQALQIAANNHIYLLLTVMDSTMWGGSSYSGTVQMGGHSAIITSATVQQTYLDNALKPLLQHIAGSPNKNMVLGYDLVNEPESQMSGYWGGSNLAAGAVQSFVQKCTSYVHTYSGGGYATVGAAKPQWAATWTGLGLDFYQIHYYANYDGGGIPGSALPTYASLNLDKPCIVGEFQTVDSSYGLTDTAAYSAQWYLDTIYKDGYAGALAWSYRVGDGVSNWSSFQPVFTNWAQTHSAFTGPK